MNGWQYEDQRYGRMKINVSTVLPNDDQRYGRKKIEGMAFFAEAVMLNINPDVDVLNLQK
ncbi:hypothetical protein BLOT_014910 [Blomia tropicalis]|nr:hypothetical protein BLOT_014910 [Blomia tropicalis]